MNTSQPQPKHQAGFTIVELLVATLIFSIVLLVITFGVIHFTNSYYKGVNSSMTQTAAQSVIDTVTQAVQFGSDTPTVPDNTHFCAGSKMFLYNEGVQMGSNPTNGNRGLYVVPANASCSDPGTLPTGGTELLSEHMRLTKFSVDGDGSNNIYNISVQVAYGDPDLLCNADPAATHNPGGCQSGTSYAAGASVIGSHIECKTTTGSQFCSVSGLSTAAQQRVAD